MSEKVCIISDKTFGGCRKKYIVFAITVFDDIEQVFGVAEQEIPTLPTLPPSTSGLSDDLMLRLYNTLFLFFKIS